MPARRGAAMQRAPAWRGHVVLAVSLALALALPFGVAGAPRALGQHSRRDALVSAAGRQLRQEQAAAPDAGAEEVRVLQAAAAAQTNSAALSEAELEAQAIQAFEDAEAEEEDIADITQPGAAELAAHTGAVSEPEAAAQTAAQSTQAAAAATGRAGAEDVQPEAQAGETEAAKGVLPADVEESIARAIDAHGSGAEPAAGSGDVAAGLEEPAGGGEPLGGGGGGDAEAAQAAAVGGGQGRGAGGSLTSADVGEEEAVLEALEEKLEQEPPPKDAAEAEEREEEELELAVEEGVLEAEAEELRQLEAPKSPAQLKQQQQQQQQQEQQQEQQEEAKPPAQAEGSLVQQGVILGGAIKDMVADNSTGIAGAVAVILAIVAGVGVAVAGIALYRRVRRRRDGKPGPRIIEIGSLTGSRKSPSYARVGSRSGDAEGSGGAPWRAWEERWEDDGRAAGTGSGGGGAAARGGSKQKKAWDWDEDW